MSRVLCFTLLGFLLVTLMGSFQQLFGMSMVVVDIPLIIVLYLAMAGGGLGGARSLSGGRTDWSGGITGILLGYVTDVLGGGIKGLHCFTLALMYLLCRRAGRHVYLTGPLNTIIVTFIASVVASIVGLAIRWFAGIEPTLGSVGVMAAQGILTAAAAYPLLKLLRVIDNKLTRESAERGTL